MGWQGNGRSVRQPSWPQTRCSRSLPVPPVPHRTINTRSEQRENMNGGKRKARQVAGGESSETFGSKVRQKTRCSRSLPVSPVKLLTVTAATDDGAVGEKTPAYIPWRKLTKRDGRGTDLITSPLTNTSPLTDTSRLTDTSSLITARATCAGTCAKSGGREERVAAVWSGPWRAT